MLFKLLGFLSSPKRAVDVTLWHKTNSIFPVTLINGEFSNSSKPLWRRYRNGNWEYQQDAETEEEWENRGI